MDRLSQKYERLKRIIGSYGSLIVAYSGGVDSTLLLRVASDVLGDNLLAVTAASPSLPREELESAKRMARRLGVRHRVIRSDELADKRFVRNPPERCYWCKRGLLRKLGAIANREKMAHVAVASQMDDLSDYRPGERAAREMGAVSPLRSASFTKLDVRRLSRRLGLPGWRREAAACLASRLPYGERISAEKLERVARAEAFLRRKGFRQVRVRSYGEMAGIEVDKSQIGRFFRRSVRKDVVRELERIGFASVSVDLEGYRVGSLNAALGKKKGMLPA